MCRKLFYSLSLILLLSLVGTSTAQNIDPSLVGWWTFEDGFGSVAKDLSGKSVDAEITGDVSWGQDKQYGGILLFDGTLDAWEYVFIDGDFNLPFYTITMWLRVDGDTGAPQDVLSAYAPGVDHGILLELRPEGTLRYLHRYPLGLGGGSNIYTTTTYDDGQWYHMATMREKVMTKGYYWAQSMMFVSMIDRFRRMRFKRSRKPSHGRMPGVPVRPMVLSMPTHGRV